MEATGGCIFCLAAHSFRWVSLTRTPVSQFTLGRGGGLLVLAIGPTNPSEDTGYNVMTLYMTLYTCSIDFIVRFRITFATQHSTHFFVKAPETVPALLL